MGNSSFRLTHKTGAMSVLCLRGMPRGLGVLSAVCSLSLSSHLICWSLSGDVRVNEQSGLAMIHNLLLREHNRVADYLQKLNPEWNDEIVFQEARRIVAAEIQHITYNEWSPLIIGQSSISDQ